MTKEIENTIFQRIKIDQINKQTQTVSEMFHGAPWFLESSFLEMKKREWGIKMHSTSYISPEWGGQCGLPQTTSDLLIPSTSQLSETLLMEEFGYLKRNPLFDGPL